MNDARPFGLTTRAAEMLAVIREFRVLCGESPTYRELASACNISLSGVHRLVKQLAERGFIERLPGRRQSIRPVDWQTILLPPDVILSIRHAAREAGRTPEEHVAALVRSHCPSPSPF